MATNPFEALLTPETLDQRRQAELEDQNAKSPSFWTRYANRSGMELRAALRTHGIGLTPEDRKAAYNQGIMQQAAAAAKGMIGEKWDPDEAHASALENAAQEFLKGGNFEEAQQVLLQASQIRKMQQERRKLKADADYLESVKPVVETTKAEAAATRAGAAVTTAGAAKTRAETDASVAPSKIYLNEARARLYDRTDPNKVNEFVAGSKKYGITPSEYAKNVNTMSGWVGYSAKVEQLAHILARAPKTGSKIIGGPTVAVQELGGALGLTPGSLSQIISGMDKTDRETYNAFTSEIDRTANRLGVNRAIFQSLVIDLAYERARARDGGGRLSDKDIEMSIKALGASGDAEAMLSVLRMDMDNLYQSAARNMRSFGMDRDEEPIWQESKQRAQDLGLVKFDRPTPSGQPPAQSGPVQPKSEAERLALPSGTVYIDPKGNLRRKK